jgi:ribose/xylose/arabinose/galactoside ABC-type transport system permease subunit
MRACSYNRSAASLVGIDVKRMVLFSFAISSAMGSVAGIIAAPLTMTSYDVGVMLGLKGFCAAIIGGMSSGSERSCLILVSGIPWSRSPYRATRTIAFYNTPVNPFIRPQEF